MQDAHIPPHAHRLVPSLPCPSPASIGCASLPHVSSLSTLATAGTMRSRKQVSPSRLLFAFAWLACATGIITSLVMTPYVVHLVLHGFLAVVTVMLLNGWG